MITIRRAASADFETLAAYDHHITPSELSVCIAANRIYIAEEDDIFVGWLRYNLFWDNIPFMNMLYVLDGYRGRGIGSQLVVYWEAAMQKEGHDTVMTSTVSEEYAQHFYHKRGYKTIGGFLLNDDPYEVILSKKLK